MRCQNPSSPSPAPRLCMCARLSTLLALFLLWRDALAATSCRHANTPNQDPPHHSARTSPGRSLPLPPSILSLPLNILLRSFVSGCMRVQVADELVKEFKLDPTITFDEKNIRRRIYDALNVLMAMDIITRDKKNIRCCMHHSARARAL